MPTSFQPQILHNWLTPFNLTPETFIELPYHLQAALIGFLFPDETAALDEETRANLNFLGRIVLKPACAETPPKVVWEELFRLFLGLGEPDPAGRIFVRLWPPGVTRPITYYSQLIGLDLARNDLAAALKTFGQMHQKFPNRYTTFASEAEIALFQNDFQAAQAAYARTLRIKPGSRRSLLNLALVASRQTDPKEAAARLLQLEHHFRPEDIFPLKAAHLWQKLGNSIEVARLFEVYRPVREKQQTELARQVASAISNSRSSPLPPVIVENKVIGPVPAVETKPGSQEVVRPGLPAPASPTDDLPSAAYRLLREVFGHPAFRLGQKQAIIHILAGRDTLAVLPTGAGKSLCYQLPALLLDRPILVLSPLISLMKDQFDKLPDLLKTHALFINSSLEPAEAARRLRVLSQPGSSIRLVYAAPERLRQTPFVKALNKSGLGLIVVDEAHCVTLWGNDFRPDYLFIRQALAGQTAPMLAVTATATPEIAGQISRELGRRFTLVRDSVYRPNLSFSVEKFKGRVEKRLPRVAELCKNLAGSGIIYTRSREKCELIAAYLQHKGLKAAAYHAGMDSEARRQTQENWSRNRIRVMVATIAFGMGIDKPDVRFIIHFNPATSLENYMQEAGRAGRDGALSRCIMIYSPGDKGNLTHWLREENRQLDLKTLLEIYEVIAEKLGGNRDGLVPMNELLAGKYSTFPPPDEDNLRVALSLLEKAGLLERNFDLPSATKLGLPGLAQPGSPPPEVARLTRMLGLQGSEPRLFDLVMTAAVLGLSPVELDSRLLDWHEAGFLTYRQSRREPYLALKATGNAASPLSHLVEQRQQVAEQRLTYLDGYLKGVSCRQVLLARHFGDELTQVCGICDNCTQRERKPEMPHNFEPKSTAKQPSLVLKPVPTYSPDEITASILGCLRLITGGEGQVGRSGLVNLLLGKRSAFGTTANNPYKGKFAAFRQKEAENLVEKLALTGFIEEHPATLSSGRTYQAIQVSEKGHLWLDEHKSLLP